MGPTDTVPAPPFTYWPDTPFLGEAKGPAAKSDFASGTPEPVRDSSG